MKTLRSTLLAILFWITMPVFSSASINLEIPILGLILVETERGKFKVITIHRLGPFGRYSFFRKGDVILKINDRPTTYEALLELTPTDQPFFTILKLSSGKIYRVQINLRWSRKMPQYQRN